MRKFYLIMLILLFCLTALAEETRVRIAVIETGLTLNSKIKPFLCKDLSISVLDGDEADKNPFEDPHGHGTCVAGLIAKNLDSKKQCIVLIKYWTPEVKQKDFVKNELAALQYAIKIKANFINLSLGGGEAEPKEEALLKDAISKGVKIAVASGNNSGWGVERDAHGKEVYKKDVKGKKIPVTNIFGHPICEIIHGKKICQYIKEEAEMAQNLDENCNFYPACYDLPAESFHVVGSYEGRLNEWGGMHYYGNYGERVKYEEPGTDVGSPIMTGTSMSCAIHMGKWASGKLD